MPKLKQDMRAILTTNWKIWIPFQFLNFNFVPQQLQVCQCVLQCQKRLVLLIPAACMLESPAACSWTKHSHRCCQDAGQ